MTGVTPPLEGPQSLLKCFDALKGSAEDVLDTGNHNDRGADANSTCDTTQNLHKPQAVWQI